MNQAPANSEYPASANTMASPDGDSTIAALMSDGGASDDFLADTDDWPQPNAPEGEAEPAAARITRVSFAPFAEAGDATVPRGLDFLLDVELHVTVELGRTNMTIKEVLAVGPGTIIELDTLAGDNVDILVNGTLIAKGEVVVVDEKFGVRVTEVVSPAKRIQSLARRDGA